MSTASHVYQTNNKAHERNIHGQLCNVEICLQAATALGLVLPMSVVNAMQATTAHQEPPGRTQQMALQGTGVLQVITAPLALAAPSSAHLVTSATPQGTLTSLPVTHVWQVGIHIKMLIML